MATLVEAESIEGIVRANRLLSPDALARAATVRAETGERFAEVLTRLGMMSERALAGHIAEATGLPLIEAAALPNTPVEGANPAYAFLQDARALPVAIRDDRLVVALADPFDRFAVDALAFAFGLPVDRAIGFPGDIESAIDRLYGTDTTPGAGPDASADETDLERLRDLVSDAPVIRAVNRLIADAVAARASDIHVEPAEDRLVLRYRIDGDLVTQTPLPPSMKSALVSRIKVMAGLNIAERRLPQDGRMRVAVRGNEIDLRVATAPSIHGESVVLRILDRANLALDFETLGFTPAMTERLRAALARPYGIMLVTGPTGSGKTTTLYAAIDELNSDVRKILTVEDPIEYRMSGIIQLQVNPDIGLSFASALRSFLRQDPDVMMVGEIRDQETAQIAVQAALTGHTILSTLHTNTAAGAITRLFDMGVEPFLLSSTLSAVLAQRLVRRLCDQCRHRYHPDAAECAALGLTQAEAGEFYAPVGCDACAHTGFAGRIALIELLVIDDSVAAMMLDRRDTRELAQAAQASGALSTLLADGIAKVRAGQTTVQEILRVAAES